MQPHETSQELFWWLLGNDPLSVLILGCNGTKQAKAITVPSSGAYLEWYECLANAPTGLAAQMLACNVEHIEVLPCDCNSEPEPSSIVERWNALTPGLISHYTAPITKRLNFFKRSGQRVRYHSLAIPRRLMFGLVLRAPFNFTDSHDLATIKSLAYLRSLGKVPYPDRTSLSIQPVPKSSVKQLLAQDCLACGVCTRYCPESALTIHQTDHVPTTTVEQPDLTPANNCVLTDHQSANESAARNTSDGLFVRELLFQPSVCSGCNQCIYICPNDLLSAGEPFDLRAMQLGKQEVLSSNVMATCPGCKVPFATDQAGSLCELCLFRQDNPFGYKLPAGFKSKRNVQGRLSSSLRQALNKTVGGLLPTDRPDRHSSF